MVKGIVVIIDGLGDLPCNKLNGKTPLEAARKDNLNYLASHGKLGIMHSIKPGVAPESDTAIISILGNEVMGSFRGQLEAMGAGIKLQRGDLAIRTNFATIDNLKDKKVIDRRAGRNLTTAEADKLADAINKHVKLKCKFIFKNTIQHRGVLIFKGGFSDNITNTDSAYHSPGKIANSPFFKFSRALDEEDNSEYTANLLNEFIEQSYKILNEHPVNKERRKKGLMPANIILTRDASTELPKIKQFKKWAGIAYMPLEIGISKASGMKTFAFNYPEMKELDVYANLYAGLKKASKFSRKILKRMGKKYNYFYVHFKETDVPGHDNRPEEKKYMIEFLDNNFFSFLVKYAEKNKIKLLISADHSTPCNMKTHSADPVPVLFCDWSNEDKKEFSERACRAGKLGKLYGKNVLKLFE
jgi:2,3-bisphosphoglycerate-independent phosphoglycerate mutase